MENLPLVTENARHDFCQKVIEAKKDIEFRFIEIGGMLHEIKEKRYFEAGWGSWEEYTMELKLSEPTISRLIRIYETFILRFGFSPEKLVDVGGYTIVAQLLPEIKENTPKSDVETWVDEIVGLSRSDVKKAINERKLGISSTDCVHDDTYTLKICRVCGERWKLE